MYSLPFDFGFSQDDFISNNSLTTWTSFTSIRRSAFCIRCVGWGKQVAEKNKAYQNLSIVSQSSQCILWMKIELTKTKVKGKSNLKLPWLYWLVWLDEILIKKNEAEFCLIKKIKNKAKFGGSHKPTLNEKTKRLRHNERQMFFWFFILVFAFHPSGLIPFPFGFFPTPPTDLLSFFFFFVLFFSFFFVK